MLSAKTGVAMKKTCVPWNPRTVQVVKPLTNEICADTLLGVAEQTRRIDSLGRRRGLRGQRRDVILVSANEAR